MTTSTTIQSRRKIIVIVLLCLAAAGALVRQFAEPGTLRNIGTLMMLLWLPVIGNIISWLVARIRRPAAPGAASFEAGAPFQPHALVELTLRTPMLPSEDTPILAGEHRCALVIDNEGFSARWFVAPGETFRRGVAQTLDVEFLAPALALARFQPGAAFRMLVGESFVGDGRVLRSNSSSDTKT
ncbi:hypothetical protein SRS16CHR_02111 [Variovorax sp. SRS16]|uniref:hypothetical protein n=1 Tax=Variovorax sp. SRS16 TaxID=282217 RepID=UPI001317042B|nr:hypothetical protein [Variovorax sp. SRS16]VTU17838.1 hypothetical protein SRS16CHR_02111 [Variovorax sp. SRS16]